MKRVITVLVIGVFLTSVVGCASWKKRDKGAAIGAGAGAVVGGAIGHQAGNTAVGAILETAISGATGAYIGNYIDKQAEEIERALEGARVERIGEGIKVPFDSGIPFDIDKSDLRPEAKENLKNLAVILNKYDETEILIEGHTDATGSRDHNLDLSIRRAQSIANYMTGLNVLPNRFRIMGYGEDQPVASNDTKEGRQANRRVEIAIFASEKLKKVAQSKVEG